MSKIEKPKSWRDVIAVHPAADLFPMMSREELVALGEDIEQHGLRTDIAVWQEASGRPWFLLDGRNRLDAAELVGLPVQIIKKGGDVAVKVGNHMNAVDDITSMDPYEWVISANLHRRHLTPEQKREIIAKVLKAQPEKSNRAIAKQTKTDHKTVGAVRDKLEATGELPQLTKTVGTDGKARKKPTRKKRHIAEDDATPKEYRDAFLIRADQAREFAFYAGPIITPVMIELADRAVAAWSALAQELRVKRFRSRRRTRD